MTAPASGLDRLSYFVDARLAQLGMTKEEVAHRGGPAVDTLTKLRKRGGAAKPSFETLQRYDAALGWQPGSAAAAMLGDDPRSVTATPTLSAPTEEPGRKRRPTTPLEAGDIVTTFLARLAEEIRELELLRAGLDARIAPLRAVHDGLRSMLGSHEEPTVGRTARATRRQRARDARA